MNFKQGDEVKVTDIVGLENKIGIICGISGDYPHSGIMYIVIFEKEISEVYPFKAYPVSEKNLVLIKK